MLINKLDGNYQQLRVSPYGIKEMLIQRIDEQIRKGPEGYICFKANAITERDIIDKLRQASDAGVEVRMIIRESAAFFPESPAIRRIFISAVLLGDIWSTREYISSAEARMKNSIFLRRIL